MKKKKKVYNPCNIRSRLGNTGLKLKIPVRIHHPATNAATSPYSRPQSGSPLGAAAAAVGHPLRAPRWPSTSSGGGRAASKRSVTFDASVSDRPLWAEPNAEKSPKLSSHPDDKNSVAEDFRRIPIQIVHHGATINIVACDRIAGGQQDNDINIDKPGVLGGGAIAGDGSCGGGAVLHGLPPAPARANRPHIQHHATTTTRRARLTSSCRSSPGQSPSARSTLARQSPFSLLDRPRRSGSPGFARINLLSASSGNQAVIAPLTRRRRSLPETTGLLATSEKNQPVDLSRCCDDDDDDVPVQLASCDNSGQPSMPGSPIFDLTPSPVFLRKEH